MAAHPFDSIDYRLHSFVIVHTPQRLDTSISVMLATYVIFLHRGVGVLKGQEHEYMALGPKREVH